MLVTIYCQSQLMYILMSTHTHTQHNINMLQKRKAFCFGITTLTRFLCWTLDNMAISLANRASLLEICSGVSPLLIILTATFWFLYLQNKKIQQQGTKSSSNPLFQFNNGCRICIFLNKQIIYKKLMWNCT